MAAPGNYDPRTVEGFGDEWTRFDQTALEGHDAAQIFNSYFHIFPWTRLPAGAIGADVGCGSGRWAKLVAPRVGELHLVDASRAALRVAETNLRATTNVRFHHCSVEDMPLEDASLDFAYSLGALHHVPDTEAAIRAVAAKLRSGAPLLLYLYYAFDNQPAWYRGLWRVSDLARRVIARCPFPLRLALSEGAAFLVYLPLARSARLVARYRDVPSWWPLAFYRDKSLYVIRTDALDRFGTRLERRFTRPAIREMMERASLTSITFSDRAPYWCAVGYKT
jgi:SAM-dependent methyltransferase